MRPADYLRGSNGEGPAVRATVSEDRAITNNALVTDTVLNFPAKFIATVGTVNEDTNVLIEDTITVFYGYLSGTIIMIEEFAPGYSDIGNTEGQVVLLKPNTTWADTVADVMASVDDAVADAEQAVLDADAALADANAATAASNAAITANNAAVATNIADNNAAVASNIATNNAAVADNIADNDAAVAAAVSSANTATTNANNAASSATTAAGSATTAAGNANTATSAANTATTNANAAATAANDAADAAEAAVASMFLAAHPVNSIYISVGNTNPGSTYGGTWVAWGAGRMIVGRDASDPDFDTAEETSGSKTHTHTLSDNGWAHILIGSANAVARFINVPTWTYSRTNSGGASATATTTSATPLSGATDSGSSMPPYIVAYMWKRTA